MLIKNLKTKIFKLYFKNNNVFWLCILPGHFTFSFILIMVSSRHRNVNFLALIFITKIITLADFWKLFFNLPLLYLSYPLLILRQKLLFRYLRNICSLIWCTNSPFFKRSGIIVIKPYNSVPVILCVKFAALYIVDINSCLIVECLSFGQLWC